MKMLFLKLSGLLLILALAAGSCGGGGSKKTEEPETNTTGDISDNPDYRKGLTLVAKNKCLVCHAVDSTITGPPYRQVALKYANYPDTIVAHLARKVITGGSGVWGQVQMIPHPDISQEDAETMVRYILLLGKQ